MSNEASMKVINGVKTMAEFCEAVLAVQASAEEWERRYYEATDRANRSEAELLTAHLRNGDLKKTVDKLETAFASLSAGVRSVEEVLAKHRSGNT